MARLDYLEPGSSREVDELYGRITAMGRPVLNLYRVLANQPGALAAFLDMSGYVRGGSSLNPGIRELVILATAHELEQDYEVEHHTAAAIDAGVPEAKLRAVAPGGSLEALSVPERCAVEFARQAARSRTCDESTFRRLISYFSSQAIVDLVVTAAWYHLCAVILGTLRVDLEENTR